MVQALEVMSSQDSMDFSPCRTSMAPTSRSWKCRLLLAVVPVLGLALVIAAVSLEAVGPATATKKHTVSVLKGVGSSKPTSGKELKATRKRKNSKAVGPATATKEIDEGSKMEVLFDEKEGEEDDNEEGETDEEEGAEGNDEEGEPDEEESDESSEKEVLSDGKEESDIEGTGPMRMFHSLLNVGDGSDIEGTGPMRMSHSLPNVGGVRSTRNPKDKFTFKVETNDLFLESQKWRSLQSGTFLPLPADEFVRTLEQQRLWPKPDTPLDRWSPPIEDMWDPPIEMLISPTKYSSVVKAPDLASIDGGLAEGFFFAQPVLPGAPRVVLKATRRTELPRERVQTEMYKDANRCKLISSIGDNLLGYLGCTFPVQGTNGYFMVQEMEEKGFPIACVAEPDYIWKNHCPWRDGEWLWKPASFDNEQIAAIILGAMRAVAGMKEAGFVSHGDVNPLNILIPKNAMELSPEQLAKATRLIDHDSAVITLETDPNLSWSDFYMPPEFYGQDLTLPLLSRVDVWSCGMTLLELVLGSHPMHARLEADEEEFFTHEKELFWISEHFIHDEIDEVLVESPRLEMLPLLQGMLAKQDERWDIGTAMERLQSFIDCH